MLEMSTEELYDLMNKKYGLVKSSYGKPDVYASEHGLFIHHKKENIEPGLSTPEARKQFPKYQQPENLVYCNFVEHFLIHVKIIEELANNPTFDSNIKTTLAGGVGKIRGSVENVYAGTYNGSTGQEYINRINTEAYKEFFMAINERYNGVFGANQTLYSDMLGKLNETGKCLVILGCGGGKTTTALGYIKEIYNGIKKALVVCPKSSIKESWTSRASKYVETITYAKLARSYKTIDFNNYSCVVADEFHHAAKVDKAWGRAFQFILEETNLKLIGLTAEKYRSNGDDVAEQIFGDSIVEGKGMAEQIASGNAYSFNFISAIYDMPSEIDEYLKNELDYSDQKINEIKTSATTTELYGKLKIDLSKLPSIDTILKINMPNRPIKGIIFAPTIAEIPQAIELIKHTYPNETYYILHSDLPKEERKNIVNTFENADHGFLASVDMVGEGMHFTGINTLVCLRKTRSPLVLNQQLGRIIALKSQVAKDPEGIVFDLVNNKDNVTYRAKTKEQRIAAESANTKISALKSAIVKAYTANYSSQKVIKDYVEDANAVIAEIEDKLRVKNLNLNERVDKIADGTIKNFIDQLTVDQQKKFNELISTMSKKLRGHFGLAKSKTATKALKPKDTMKELRQQDAEKERAIMIKATTTDDNSAAGQPVERVLSVMVNLLGTFTIKQIAKNPTISADQILEEMKQETGLRAEYFYSESGASMKNLKAAFEKNKQMFIDLFVDFITTGKTTLLPLVTDILEKTKQDGIHKTWLSLNPLFSDDIVANDKLCEKLFGQFSSQQYSGEALLNPCCGRGTFLKYAVDKLGYPKDMVAGYDIDNNYVEILNYLGYTKVFCANALTDNIEEKLENL